MKTIARLILLTVGLGATARADFSTTFDGKEQAIDATLIGVDGWAPRLATPTPNFDSARVVKARWAGYRRVAMLKGANLRNEFATVTGDKATFKLELALAFAEGGSSLRTFRLGFNPAPIGEIFFDQGPEGGLGYGADGSGRGGSVVLPRKEIKPNSFYTVEAEVDFASGRYDLTITGKKRDDSPFSHVEKGVAFEPKKQRPGMIYLLTGGNITAYLGSLSLVGDRKAP